VPTSRKKFRMEESKQTDSSVAKQSDPEIEAKISAAIAEGVRFGR
jgi:hypothetical protein